MSSRLPSIFITWSIHVFALGAFNTSSASYSKYTVLALRFSYCVREWGALIPCQGTSVPLFILSLCPSPPSPGPATPVLLSASVRSAFQHSSWWCFQFFWRQAVTTPPASSWFPGMENHLLMSLCMPQRVLLGSHCSSCLKGLCCPPSGSHHCLFLGRVSHCNPDWHGIGDVAGLSLFLLPQLPRAGIT